MKEQFMQERLGELYELLLKLKTPQDCKELLEDLCTYKEVEQMALRAYSAKLFKQGKTYSEIIAMTELSSATISRVSKCMTHGSGGYLKFI